MSAPFRAKKLDIGAFANARVIRDHTKRKVFAENEPLRQALRFIVRNTTLPGRMRAQAQLKLAQMHCYTRGTQIRNRCVMGGRARGIMRDFRMSRINESDQVTSLADPGEYFQFFITNNSRYNDVQREAMHACVRQEVTSRLISLGIPLLYLPTFTQTAPAPPEPHLPIHCTSLDLLEKKRQIVVIVNRACEDLAIHSYRVLSRSGGINKGSAVSIVQDIKSHAETVAKANGSTVEDEMPGIVILNTGQLLFSHKLGKAVTPTTWSAMPRKSAAHPPAKIDAEWNTIKGNGSFEDHIDYVFTRLLGNEQYVRADADFYIMGLCEGGDEFVRYLYRNQGRHRIAALALTAPVSIHTGDSTKFINENSSTIKFMSEHARAWRLSSWPVNTPEANPTSLEEMKKMMASQENKTQVDKHKIERNEGKMKEEKHEIQLFPVLSGGEERNEECIITAAQKGILDWFAEVKEGGGASGYRNPKLEIREEVKKGLTVDVEEYGW
ncbi:MAG: hypothetical protein Q9159_006741 [Coniocarpon cinnabarinum]